MRSSSETASLLDGLRAFIEPAHLRTDADSCLQYGRDWTRLYSPNPLAVALPFKHELSVVEFSYPLTWITATVLFAIYYAKGGWMQRCIAVQNAKTQG